jgi:tetratricopeptide (TPR) repeat protein
MDTPALQNGARLHSEGRFDEARKAYEALLEGPPQQVATAHYLLALLTTDMGAPESALAHYDAAIALGAASPDLFYRHGELLRQVGRHEAAIAGFDSALALEPDHADAAHMRGVALAALGRLDEAVASYDRAAALKPDAKSIWNNRGIALETLDRLEAAAASYDRAIGIDAYYARAYHNRGSVRLKLGRSLDAIADFDKAAMFDPNLAEAWSYRAVAMAGLERYIDAIESAERALALRPGYPEALNTRSVAERALMRPEAALASAEAALQARPGFVEALNSKASALARLNRYEEACATYRLALEAKPQDPSILLNFGLALEAMGDLEGARAAFSASHAAAPNLPDAAFAAGLVNIRAGALQPGFALYETRWTQKGGPRHTYPPETLWLGREPLGDRTLLVHAEQGFGDAIQFCRFAPRAAASSRLILQVQPPLKSLMTSIEGVERVLGADEETPPFDLHIPIMSLPLALGVELGDVTPTMPYLHARSDLVEGWRRRLPPADGPRIGIAWTGNPGHDNDRNRSMSLDTLAPLLKGRAQFVSLQKDYRDADLARLERLPQILRVEAELKDFADTAALIACCDLVIAVDTSVAHLAGALNKPLWLMLPRFSDWRWMNARADSPWYPSATLFRQTEFGVWDDAIEQIAARLRQD